MGFQTYTCAICGASVTKRTSRFVEGTGRICKTHDEFKEILDRAKENKLRNVARFLGAQWGTEGLYKPVDENDEKLTLSAVIDFINEAVCHEKLNLITMDVHADVSPEAIQIRKIFNNHLSVLKEYGVINATSLTVNEDGDEGVRFATMLRTTIVEIAQMANFDWGCYKKKGSKTQPVKKNNPKPQRKRRVNAEDTADSYKFKAKRGAKEAPRKQARSGK